MAGVVPVRPYTGRFHGDNLDVKNRNVVDEAHRDPAELLAESEQAQKAVADIKEKLRMDLEATLLNQ
jgi:hypothetical protein